MPAAKKTGAKRRRRCLNFFSEIKLANRSTQPVQIDWGRPRKMHKSWALLKLGRVHPLIHCPVNAPKKCISLGPNNLSLWPPAARFCALFHDKPLQDRLLALPPFREIIIVWWSKLKLTCWYEQSTWGHPELLKFLLLRQASVVTPEGMEHRGEAAVSS